MKDARIILGWTGIALSLLLFGLPLMNILMALSIYGGPAQDGTSGSGGMDHDAVTAAITYGLLWIGGTAVGAFLLNLSSLIDLWRRKT